MAPGFEKRAAASLSLETIVRFESNGEKRKKTKKKERKNERKSGKKQKKRNGAIRNRRRRLQGSQKRLLIFYLHGDRVEKMIACKRTRVL